jgi:hypothetical protein
VPHDGSFPAAPLTLTRPGCYVVSSVITTSDAIPNVRRAGDSAVIAVAPVHVRVSPAGHGVALAGPVTARVSVAGTTTARLSGVTATLLGPRPSDDGSCDAISFPARGRPLTATATHAGVRLTSQGAVTATGCYGFQVAGTVDIPLLGSAPLTWSRPVAATSLVLSPAVSVDDLSSSAVTTGGQLSADVTVSGSWTQPGTLRLELRHLPYNWQGCFDRDWTSATATGTPGPPVATHGDGTYRVPTSAVPSSGCWTVVPVLTLNRNPRISVTDSAPIDPTTAATALRPAASPVGQNVPLQRAAGDGSGQVLDAGAGMLALIVVALGWTLSMALRDR